MSSNLEKVQKAIQNLTDNDTTPKPEWNLRDDLQFDDLDICELEGHLYLPDCSLVECVTVADIVKVLDEQV